MKEKITATGDDSHFSTQAIYFTRWPMNEIGRGQHAVVSTALRASPFRTFLALGMRHTIRMHIPSLNFTLTNYKQTSNWGKPEWLPHHCNCTMHMWVHAGLLRLLGWHANLNLSGTNQMQYLELVHPLVSLSKHYKDSTIKSIIILHFKLVS